MSILVDTNILTRYSDPDHPHHPAAIASVAELKSRGESLRIVTQNLYEFWAVATRPLANGGLGLTTTEASASSRQLRSLFLLLPDHLGVFQIWESLVLQYDVKGKSAHDARLAAAMQVHGIQSILTFNGRDFARYQHVTVIDPNEINQQATKS